MWIRKLDVTKVSLYPERSFLPQSLSLILCRDKLVRKRPHQNKGTRTANTTLKDAGSHHAEAGSPRSCRKHSQGVGRQEASHTGRGTDGPETNSQVVTRSRCQVSPCRDPAQPSKRSPGSSRTVRPTLYDSHRSQSNWSGPDDSGQDESRRPRYVSSLPPPRGHGRRDGVALVAGQMSVSRTEGAHRQTPQTRSTDSPQRC